MTAMMKMTMMTMRRTTWTYHPTSAALQCFPSLNSLMRRLSVSPFATEMAEKDPAAVFRYACSWSWLRSRSCLCSSDLDPLAVVLQCYYCDYCGCQQCCSRVCSESGRIRRLSQLQLHSSLLQVTPSSCCRPALAREFH